MNEIEQKEESIQLSIDQAKLLIARKDALRALEANPHWKVLITECYFKTEPVRLVMLKSDAHAQTPELQEAIDNDILAIGGLRQFFGAVIQLGNHAEESLEGHREALDGLRNEEEDDAINDDSIDATGY